MVMLQLSDDSKAQFKLSLKQGHALKDKQMGKVKSS